MRKLILIVLTTFGILSGCNAGYGQAAECPAGFVCISQAAANKAAENARVIPTLEGKIAALEQAVKDKDATIAENKATAARNEADLTKAMHKTEIDLATKTGQLIGCEANEVRNTATINAFLQNMKKPVKVGLINF